MGALQHNPERYFVPQPANYPIRGSLALLLLATGAVLWMNHYASGPWVVLVGFAALLWMLIGWFGTVIRESESGVYNKQVDTGFRWSMSWFIFSEVMFFAAFFGALFYIRVLSVPDLGNPLHKMLWPDFAAGWPSTGPYIRTLFSPMEAWGIPAINTLLLLSSGVTLTIAHWGLVAGNRAKLTLWLFLTIALGVVFLGLQAYEYSHAYATGLKLTTGVYGSTFFLLTGFHGFHVTIGAIMLTVMLGRVLKGHFTEHHHFAFEATAWYWHFVDVVWILLFIIVYWL